MSTPEQPASPALTRKQMRDIRNTGATPIITADAPSEPPPTTVERPPAPVSNAPAAPETRVAPPAPPEPPAHVAPLPRAAAPVAVHELPGADASVDLGVAPLTRRQARQQERIRTASVPVITPEVAAAHAASVAAAASIAQSEKPAETVAPSSGEMTLEQIFGTGPTAAVDEQDRAQYVAAEAVDTGAAAVTYAEPQAEPAAAAQAPETAEADRAVVSPHLGAELLAGDAVQADLPPSFDQLISRSASGGLGTGNALILSQTPSAPPLVAPVTATGEVLITGSYNLPEGLGSTGHANGTADGKEADAVLVDGELPAHSSPTPIAASAAISTVKNNGDIIQPPTPEKGGRLMLTLAITAGVLALALVGVLILAFVTGVF